MASIIKVDKIAQASGTPEFTIPTVDGTAKSALITDGSGVLSFATGTPSSSNFLRGDGTWQTVTTTALTGSTNTWIPTITAANALTGTANFTYDGNTLDVKNSGTASSVKLYCESSNAHYQEIKAAPHSGSSNWTLTLPSTVPSVSGQALTATTAGVGSWATVGITEADCWQLTANYLSTNGDITANLERMSSTGFSLLGTGMTQSSGIFSFPSTGYWMVVPTMGFQVAASDNCGVQTYFTVNHSTSQVWVFQGSQNIGNKGSAQSSQTQISAMYIVDVTNTTECKIKFTTESMASGSGVLGATQPITDGGTNWVFIKLADT